MTEFETKMLELREREILALEETAYTLRVTERRNGADNKFIWKRIPGSDTSGGHWKWGVPDNVRRYRDD